MGWGKGGPRWDGGREGLDGWEGEKLQVGCPCEMALMNISSSN